MNAPRTAATAAAAFDHLRANGNGVTALQIELSEIAAPTGAESGRGEAVGRWLRGAGCAVATDAVGNVIARRPGRGAVPGRVVLSAHLDTVFDADQPLRVVRAGERSSYRNRAVVPEGEWHGPGIADDAAGLAAVIAVAQALAVGGVQTDQEIAFVATVGEEGRGNLRGARHFFRQRDAKAVSAFITIDHPRPNEIVHRGVGSRRFAVEFSGPGGHAWGDFGRYNPAHALAAAADRIAMLPLPSDSKATVNIGRIEAGRAVNAIPESARMEVDLRSESAAALNALERGLRTAVTQAHAKETAHALTGEGIKGAIAIEGLGRRPAGMTPPETPLVQTALQALAAEGFEPKLAASSTDANAAMAAGVPAIALGWGGRCGDLHSTREYFAPAGRERSLAAILRVLLDLAGASAAHEEGRRESVDCNHEP